MSLRTEVLNSLKWLAGARFMGQLVTWVITLVVIRILKPEDYGLMALAEIMIGFAALFREMGLYSAMVQRKDLTSRQIEQTFGILLLTNGAVFIVFQLGAPVIADFFDDERLSTMIRVLAFQFPLASIGVVQDAMLARRMAFKGKSIVNLLAMLCNGFTTLMLALSGFGVWALVFGSLMGGLVRPVGLIIVARHWCRPRFSLEGMGEMTRYGSFVATSHILWYFYSQADVFIIGKMLGHAVLGFYAVAMQLASLPMQKMAEMLGQVGLAAYSQVQDDLSAFRSHFFKVLRITSLFSFPVFFGISSVSPDLVGVVLGEQWQPAVLPLQILSLIMPLRMISVANGPILEALGRPEIGTVNILIAFVIMPPAFFLGAYYWGLAGVCIAWVTAFPVLVLIRLKRSLPLLNVTFMEYFRPMASPAIGASLMYGVVFLSREFITEPRLRPSFSLLFLVGVGALTYLIYVAVLCRGQCREVLALVRS